MEMLQRLHVLSKDDIIWAKTTKNKHLWQENWLNWLNSLNWTDIRTEHFDYLAIPESNQQVKFTSYQLYICTTCQRMELLEVKYTRKEKLKNITRNFVVSFWKKKISVRGIKEIYFSICHKLFKAFKVPNIVVGFCCFLEMSPFDQFKQLLVITNSFFNKNKIPILSQMFFDSKELHFSWRTWKKTQQTDYSSTIYICPDTDNIMKQMFLHRCLGSYYLKR